jgi:TonB family protein
MGVLSLKKLVWASAVVALFCGSLAFAQSGSTDESRRKVKSKVAPAYSDLARRMGVSGKVKIEVVIAPDGKVKSSKVLGGHPLLVQNCQDAAKEWRFLAGPEETTQVIEFEFHGSTSE